MKKKKKAKNSNSFNWASLVTIITLVPIFTGLINYSINKPLYVDGYWLAISPEIYAANNEAVHNECIILHQKRFGEAIWGKLHESEDEEDDRDDPNFSEVPQFLGTASSQKIELQFKLSNYSDGFYSGKITLVETGANRLDGIWHETSNGTEHLEDPTPLKNGVWRLLKTSKEKC